jgi:hypothetical protein
MDFPQRKIKVSRPMRFRKFYEECYAKLVSELKSGTRWVGGANRARVRNLAREQARYMMRSESA